MYNYYFIIITFIIILIINGGYIYMLQNDILHSLGLRQFVITLCTNVEVNSYSNPVITDQPASIYCPHRTTLHIFDAYYSRVFDKNSQCSYSPEHIEGNLKYSDKSTTQFGLMTECYAKSVGQIVKQLCDGTNRCNLIHQLKQKNITNCPYPSFLKVNYTCLPVYSKQEVICADSYVELSCKAFSMDMGLIVLEAVLNHNLSIQLTSPSETNLQKCLRSNTNQVPCPSIDSISIISNKCNGYLTCTVSPNLVLESLHLINSRMSTFIKQMSCTKSYLYLRYTCVHNLLLENTLRLEDSKNSIKLREKQTFKPRKRLNKSSGNGRNNQKMNDMNVMLFNDNLSYYSGQIDVSTSQLNSVEPKPRSANIAINDEILSVLNELSVSPKTKSTHIYVSALLPAVLCIMVSCIFAMAILCHRKQLFKKKLKSNYISRVLHNPTYCDQHSTYNVTIDDNNHETVCQSDMQTNHSYLSKSVKNCIPEWESGKNYTPYLQTLQQIDCSAGHTTLYCPSCNNEQKDISQLFHYQNISYGDNDIISNNNIVNQSIKASSNSSGQMPSTENSFPLTSPEMINKTENLSPSSIKCLSHGFVNNSMKHHNQCYSSQFNHTTGLIYGNFPNFSNNNINDNSKQINQQTNTLRLSEQENDVKPQELHPLNDSLVSNTKLYYYQDDELIPNIHAKLHDVNIYEKEKTTSDLQQKPVNMNIRDLSVNSSEQINCKIKRRLAPPLFSSGDDLLPDYMMNTKSPVHLKYGIIPVVRYPYDSEDQLEDSDSDVSKYPQAKDSLNYSRNYENKPDICLTVNQDNSNQRYSIPTSSTFNMLDLNKSQLSRTVSDHKVQNPISPSLIRSVTSQITNNSANSCIKISEPFTKNICTIQPINVLSNKHNLENHIESSSINVKNRSFIYDSNKLPTVNDNDDLSNSMSRSLQP
ncbi:unnamed protein product [Schistosoma rodhaini]|nr:unnamed protein product [Schistosoma rodhaini]